MNLISKLTLGLERLNHRLLGTILQFGLPQYGKKLVLLVSIFSGLQKLKVVTQEDLENLNVELGLASCPEALEFPALVSKKVWKGYRFEDSLVEGNKEGSIQAIFDNVPKWLLYANSEKMLADIRSIVNHTALKTA